MEKVVLATLAYADAVGTPLTVPQVHRRLISPTRLGSAPTSSGVGVPTTSFVGSAAPTLGETKALLDGLTERGAIHEENGWYVLNKPSVDMFPVRMSQANINADKWKKMLRKARALQMVPFVGAIAASGSLAAGTTGRHSDWDMFIIARKDRLYTARIGLLLVARFLGVLRIKSERVAPDKFCFNHYVTDNSLEIEHRSLFVAYALSGLIPVFDRGSYFAHLRQANGWTGDFLVHGVGTESRLRYRDVQPAPMLVLIRGAFELALSWTIGDGVESVLKWWQQRRIANDPATHEQGGRVVATAHELEFHPQSAERAVLARYNELIHYCGIDAREVDSGLL